VTAMPRPPDDAPRWAHEWYARAAGYFWLPCPLCGDFFGGHEWHMIDGLSADIPDPKYPAGSGRNVGICPTCTRAGRGATVFFTDRRQEPQ
jgi:hypothetical protein